MQLRDPLLIKEALLSIICCFLLLFFNIPATGQSVIISDQLADTVGDASALFELKSSNKGFLPPRVTQAQRLAINSPAEGLLVFQTDGIKGMYYYKDGDWTFLTEANSSLEAPVYKTASDTLEKTERMVLASNDIQLVLPQISAADDGLSITIKNVGIHTDLVVILASGGALIDSAASVPLPKLFAVTMIAKDGNWYFKQRTSFQVDVVDVSWHSGWKTIQQALEFLNQHMWGPTLIRLGAGNYEIDETQIINLPYPVTIQGTSYGLSKIVPATSIAGSPLFVAETETYFKMLAFDGSELTGYGYSVGEDAIQLTGSEEYYEVKDCSFTNFYKAISIQSNLELWMFEVDVYDSHIGVDLAAGSASGVVFKISETDFIGCNTGINLSSGSGATLSIINCGFYNNTTAATGISYTPATFTSIVAIAITGNTWNTTGSFINGFDFTRADGRDKNVEIANNSGTGGQNPRCRVSVLNNSSTISVGSTWTKATWSSLTQSSSPQKFSVSTNRITYQPSNRRDLMMWLTGNAQASGNNKILNVAIVKNGVSSIRYGETTVRLQSGGQPYQWATAVHLSDVGPNDYFEVWVSTPYTETFTLQDVNWLTTSQ